MDILLSGTLAFVEQRSGYIGAHNTRSKYRRCSTAFKQDIHPAGLSLPVRVDELGGKGARLWRCLPPLDSGQKEGGVPG